MAFYCHDAGSDSEGESREDMRKMFGPGALDQAIGHAIQTCWMMLPKDKKNVDELEKQIQRVVARSLKAIREDADAFGLTDQA